MATDRAKRLAGFLSDELGWETQYDKWVCRAAGCGFFTYSSQAFCSRCGTKMPSKPDPAARRELLEELEEAIKFALQEK